jgi:amidase
MAYDFTFADRKDLFDGAPVGLQIVGRRLQEEKVLGLTEIISNALQQFTGK